MDDSGLDVYNLRQKDALVVQASQNTLRTERLSRPDRRNNLFRNGTTVCNMFQ